MSAKSDPRDETAGAEYFYRRSLSVSEVLPAVGVGVAVGLAAFYVARLMLQRTPLVPRTGTGDASADAISRRRSRGSRAHGG
jgi:hypothetical protein